MMRTSPRLAFIIGAAALFAGCGGSQQIGASGAMPQLPAVAAGDAKTKYEVVYDFAMVPDGSYPTGGLVDMGGTLYGATTDGGLSFCYYGYLGYCGTVFSITPSGKENVLYPFGSPPDGSIPQASLLDVDGTLYGTTAEGGSYTCGSSTYPYGCGTVFTIATSGMEKVLHSFGGRKDGLRPLASLINVNGTLYGTTEYGGASKRCRCGTIFSITPGGKERVLHSFGGTPDGAAPYGSLIEVNRALYGTTAAGGANGWGTVFTITLSGRENVLHSFGTGADGRGPSAALIDVGGTLYGTTTSGGNFTGCNGTDFCGTVFSITLRGREKVLHNFGGNGTDGAGPVAALIDLNGMLYGTTEYGGKNVCSSGGHCGTIFSITPRGTEKVLHNFGNGTDGIHPAAALTSVQGVLYSTTIGGGKHGYGTVFALSP